MKISRIEINNFRNIEKISLEPSEKTNVIYGMNAQGKTNLLEAIYLFSGAKSFRGAKDKELVKFNCEKSNIKVEFENNSRNQSADLTSNSTAAVKKTPRVWINKMSIKSKKTVIKLKSDKKGIIYYTTDGSNPTVKSKKFRNNITLSSKKVLKYFDIPIQHANGEILKRMNRHYTPEQFYAGVELLRKTFEHPAITTDVIVGFPGDANLPADVCNGDGLPGRMEQIFVQTVLNLDLAALGDGGAVDTIYGHKNHPLSGKTQSDSKHFGKINICNYTSKNTQVNNYLKLSVLPKISRSHFFQKFTLIKNWKLAMYIQALHRFHQQNLKQLIKKL